MSVFALLGEYQRFLNMERATNCRLSDLETALCAIMTPDDAKGFLAPLRPHGAERIFKDIVEARVKADAGNAIVRRTTGELAVDGTGRARRKKRNTPGVVLYTTQDPATGLDVELGIQFERKLDGTLVFQRKGPGGWYEVPEASDPLTDGISVELADALDVVKAEQVRDWLFQAVGIEALKGVSLVGGVLIAVPPGEMEYFDTVAEVVTGVCGIRALTNEEHLNVMVTERVQAVLDEIENRVTSDGTPDWKPPSSRWIRAREGEIESLLETSKEWAQHLQAQLGEADERIAKAESLLSYAQILGTVD